VAIVGGLPTWWGIPTEHLVDQLGPQRLGSDDPR
jgi:hypothetical protein